MLLLVVRGFGSPSNSSPVVTSHPSGFRLRDLKLLNKFGWRFRRSHARLNVMFDLTLARSETSGLSPEVLEKERVVG